MEKKISKNQKMYPHRFGCSQNHPKAPKNPIVALFGDFGCSQNGGGQSYLTARPLGELRR